MGALTCNRFKRHPQSQSQSHSLSPSSFTFDHIQKKLKSSHSASSSVSRIHSYPKLLTPIVREIQAPCIVVKGFTSALKTLYSSCSGRLNLDNCADRMGNLFSNYFRAKDLAKGSCRYVSFETEAEVAEVAEVIDVDNENENENENENDGFGDLGVEEIAVVESEREDVKSIRAKYRELDEKADGKVGFQPLTSSRVGSELLDVKGLESLLLDSRPKVDVDVDVGIPYHKKLLIESSQKRDPRLRKLSFDIKLQEEKIALYRRLTPVKKDESKKDEDVLLEPFRPLTEDDEQMVAIALSSSSRRKVLVTHDNSNITITGEVLRCLRPGTWLNDEVINLYLELLKEREKKEPKKFLKCHFFNTFFYKKLISGRTGYDYKSVRRWTTQRKLGYSLSECDKIFVPVHKEIHWCLAVINKKEEKFQYLDSLGGVDKQVMRVLAKYFVDEVKDKNGEDIDVTSWQQEYVTDLPNQENGFDCGVFMIKYADFYSRDIGLCFKQEHMPYFRLRTAKEILRLRAE